MRKITGGLGGWLLAGTLLAGAGAASEAPAGMVLIPAGPFTMGSPAAQDEAPHRVTLSAFYIDTHEVTQEAYRTVMKKNPSGFKGPRRPVERVTWYEARDYCRKVGKRLPTEAEWEKAARAGTTTAYYWGETIDGAFAWYWDNSERRTHPVGEKRPNSFGLHDVSGNVWEWVADNYADDYYTNSPVENPTGPISGKYRVIRGGSWRDFPDFLRSSRRFYELPSGRFDHIGFRCASSLNGQ